MLWSFIEFCRAMWGFVEARFGFYGCYMVFWSVTGLCMGLASFLGSGLKVS